MMVCTPTRTQVQWPPDPFLTNYLSLFKYWTLVLILISFSSITPDAKFHNLLSLAAKDLGITPDPEEMGSNLLVQHQKLMLEHFGHKETAVLPEDVIQRLLLGVSTLFCFPTLSAIITIDHSEPTNEYSSVLIIRLTFIILLPVCPHLGVGFASGIKSYQTQTRRPEINEHRPGWHGLWPDPHFV